MRAADLHRGVAFGRRFGARVGTRKRVRGRIGDRGHGHVARRQHVRQRRRGVPPDQRIDGRRQRVEIAPEPPELGGIGRVGGGPDVGAEKMRAALVRIPGALDEREPALIEDLLEAGQARMQAERHVRAIGADLQHVAGGYGERRAPAAVERIVVRNHHAERVVAAAQVEDHEAAGMRALGPHEIAQELGCREGKRERGDAALEEFPSGDLHMSWYSEEPATRCTRPGAFV